MKLDNHDLYQAKRRLPKILTDEMESERWAGKIFVAGGFIRAVVTQERVNDIDINVQSKEDAEILAFKLAESKHNIIETDNAFTIKSKKHLPIQIIHRWVFHKPEDVVNSFDFSVCCAVIFFKDGKYDSFCTDYFYQDLAAKRLRYMRPVRNEDAGGSMLRVLKYYQKGYRISLDSLGYVMARMVAKIDFSKVDADNENDIGFILSGMLREVDPATDPDHEAHLPTVKDDEL